MIWPFTTKVDPALHASGYDSRVCDHHRSSASPWAVMQPDHSEKRQVMKFRDDGVLPIRNDSFTFHNRGYSVASPSLVRDLAARMSAGAPASTSSSHVLSLEISSFLISVISVR